MQGINALSMPNWVGSEKDQLDRWGDRLDRTGPSRGLAELSNAVVAEDLKMVYQSGKVEVSALCGVDVVIKRGDFAAIMGPSGCGKSTLLHLVGGLLQPTSGRIYLEGADMSSASDAERTEIRRQKVGFVFQNWNLLSALTAGENVELARQIRGNAKREDATAREVLRLLGLEDKMQHRPSQLSGGEQQRVAIARAVITRPAILLADEPTGSLDSANSGRVLGMLKELNWKRQQTIMMITHDREAASVANYVIEMRDGRIVSAR